MNTGRRPILPADAASLIGRAAGLLDPARTASRQGVQAPDAPGAPDPRRKAIELLARREHSRRELVRKLTERGFSSEQAGDAVAGLAREGWQDDQRYAEALARSRAQGGYGPVRIRAELRTHGLDEALIAAALDACEMDWGRSACELLRRRFGGRRPDTRQALARQGAFLQRRGFELDDVRRALADGGEDD